MNFSLLEKIIRGTYQGGKRLIPQRRFAPASLLDTATNPKTYQGLAQSASDTLGRALPPQFRGAGFQNVPTSALGALDDAAAAPFAGPVRQQILQKASKDFARKAGSGTTRVPVIPTGGQPVNFATPGRYRVTGGGNPPQARVPVIPTGGQPVPKITAIGGDNPIVGPIPSRLSPRGGIPPQAGGNLLGRGLQGVGLGLQGFGVLGAANQLRQGNVGQAVLEGSLMAPLPYLLGTAGLFALGDGVMTPSVADGTMKDIKLTPQQKALADKLTKERIAAGTQKATVGNSGESVTLPIGSAGNAGAAQSLDPDAPGGGYIPPTLVQQNLPPTQPPPVSQLSPQDREYAKERARVEAMVQANPDMQKQDIAEARAKVRDQGLAEWAKANPELAKRVPPGQVGYEIARDVAYPMPTSLADPSIPDLGYNINLQFDPGSAAEQTYTNPNLYQLQEYPQGQGAVPFQVESLLTPEVVEQLRSRLLRQQGRL